MDRFRKPHRFVPTLLAAVCCAFMAAGLPCQAVFAQQNASPSGYVLLRNGNVLRGTARQDGAFISIEQALVASVRLPQAEVLCWGASLHDLYKYRLEHRKPHSLSARFEDLRWCIDQGLFDIAQTELDALRKIAPSDRRILPLASVLQNARDRVRDTAVEASHFNGTSLDDGSVQDGSIRSLAGSAEQPRGLQMSLETEDVMTDLPRHLMVTYTKRIQPLLINRCGQAGCHGGSSAAVWQMEHFGSTYRLPAKITRQNLNSLLHWINDDHADASPLLVRSGQPHGGADEPPFGLGDDELRRSLQEWIAAMADRDNRSVNGAFAGEPSLSPMYASAAPIDEALPSQQTRTMSTSKPTRLPPVDDPFDPADFNRIYHRD